METIELTDQKEYEALRKVVQDLDRADILERLNGNCVSAADLIQNALDTMGVKSRILECSLIVTHNINSASNGQKQSHFVGFNFFTSQDPNSVDTHAVTLVEAEIPFIVDASVGYLINNPKLVVVAPLSNRDPDVIADQHTEEHTLTYRVKKNIRLTNIHQKTLLERTLSDQKTRKDVTTLGWLVRILIGVGVFNMIANTWLVILKFMYP